MSFLWLLEKVCEILGFQSIRGKRAWLGVVRKKKKKEKFIISNGCMKNICE